MLKLYLRSILAFGLLSANAKMLRSVAAAKEFNRDNQCQVRGYSVERVLVLMLITFDRCAWVVSTPKKICNDCRRMTIASRPESMCGSAGSGEKWSQRLRSEQMLYVRFLFLEPALDVIATGRKLFCYFCLPCPLRIKANVDDTADVVRRFYLTFQ